MRKLHTSMNLNENHEFEVSTNAPGSRSSGMLTPLFIALAMAIGVFFGSRMAVVPSGSQKESVSRINKLLNIIEDRYVDKVDRESLTENAMRDILEGLDPHSSYMSPDIAKAAHEELSGNFGGVGIQFLVYKDTLVVTHLIPDGPSERSGIHKYDRIVEVDGHSMARKDITTDDVFKRLRGEMGTKVKLKVRRRGEKKLLQFELERDAIPVSTVEAAIMVAPEIGYIRLSQFGAQTHSDFLAAVNKLSNRGMKNVILDLRDNGGGYLKEANMLADEFLSAGKLIVYTEGEHSPRQTYNATKKGRLENAQVVVLINHNSASASEIVAGALQDNDRGTIIGRRSFGKGLVQEEITPFDDGSSIRLTIARYYTPTGRSIQKPYGNGIDYAMEQVDRYEKNEFFVPDSSIFIDSLKFITPKGKVVYGGGGIMPDIFVPIDTTGRTSFYTSLLYTRIFAEFALDVVERYSSVYFKYPDPAHFADSYRIEQALFSEFLKLAERKGLRYYPGEVEHSRRLIQNQIMAEIARLIWNADGYYTILCRNDRDLQKALEVLKK
jgi:carboxyl-terminal processing protease